MRKLFVGISLLVIVLLAACQPRVHPVVDRDGDLVTINVTAVEPLYSATLQVFNATTDDIRCAVLNITDVGCTLGDILAGETMTVVVAGEVGQVYCIVFGFSNEDLSISSYRPYRCEIGGA